MFFNPICSILRFHSNISILTFNRKFKSEEEVSKVKKFVAFKKFFFDFRKFFLFDVVKYIKREFVFVDFLFLDVDFF